MPADAAPASAAKPPPATSTPRPYSTRRGRITPAQRRALVELGQHYLIEFSRTPLHVATCFGREAPLTLEIGCGNGDVILALAAARAEQNFLAVETYPSGVGSLLRRAHANELHNVRIIQHDATEVLQWQLPSASLDTVLLFFPDPWPKKRHHKRRLVTPAFLAQVARCLRTGGCMYLATDWPDYLHHVHDCLARTRGLRNVAGERSLSPRPAWRPPTRFEQAAANAGRRVYDLVLTRDADTPAS